MAWTTYQSSLAIFMVITGSFNTLTVKYADQQIALGQDDQPRHFYHPFMQSSFMFLGEMMCLLVFKIAYYYFSRKGDGSVDTHPLTKGAHVFNHFLLLIPAMCDTCATSVMYIGLNMTYSSSFQMLRGSSIIFTAVLSMGFLDRKLGPKEWSGIIMVILGLAIVGMSDMIAENKQFTRNSILTGDLLIICAQVITSVQMVVEEKYIVGRNIPALQAVGWEGVFGFIFICMLLVPLNFIRASFPFADNSRGTMEDTAEALAQIRNSSHLLMAVVGISFSIAFFNFAGVSVTKEMSATTRMVLDSVRTIVIWVFSLVVREQSFQYLQLIGFTILFSGTCVYNNVIIPQLIRKCRYRLGRHRSPPNDRERIISMAADDIPEPK